MIFCGIDVAKLKYAGSLVDEKGQVLKAAFTITIIALVLTCCTKNSKLWVEMLQWVWKRLDITGWHFMMT